MECSECGVDGSKIVLFDVLSSQGVEKICKNCHRGDMVVLRRPTTFQLKESEKKTSVYNGKYNEFNPVKKELKKTEESLKSLVDRTYENRVSVDRKPRLDLVENFHWIIMRARRMKKLTQAQLAKEISESESAIKMAERGVLPEDDYRLVNKIESLLGIKIVKSPLTEKLPEKEAARIIKLDENTVHNFTIDDLKRMKELKEGVLFRNSEEEDRSGGDEPKTF